MTGQSVGSDASLLSCFLFRPRKRLEKRRKCSHINVSNALVTRTLTPPAQTAHAAKQGSPLPRPQRGFVLPAKFLLFRRAFIYIHFPVLCDPPLYQQREKIRQSYRHKFYPPTAFQLLAQTAHVRFHERKRVHTRLSEKDRTQRLTRRNRGVLDGGAITTLGAFHTFRKPCVARCQNGKLCRFWGLVVGAPKERRKPSEQRCAYAHRCSEGVAAPPGRVIFSGLY